MAEAAASPAAHPVTLQHSSAFPDWLRETGMSLAITTYQTNRLFLVGAGEERLSAFERLLDRPMGIATDGAERFWLATRHQMWRFQSAGALARFPGYDRVFVPRESRTTGEVDAHDVAVGADGRVLFVNTLYSC